MFFIYFVIQTFNYLVFEKGVRNVSYKYLLVKNKK